jgi:DNA-binding response OmpR family regulator
MFVTNKSEIGYKNGTYVHFHYFYSIFVVIKLGLFLAQNMNVEKAKILLVEDDNIFGFLLKRYLEVKSYKVDIANTAREGYDLFCKRGYDICLLDVRMPDKNGFVLAREIKAKNKNVPIIFVTANATKEQTLVGFDAGADDYITKPFAMEELLLRMQAILRRTLPPVKADTNNDFTQIQIGNYTFNYNTHTLNIGSNVHKLTNKETQLLHLLAQNVNQLVPRVTALKMIWQQDSRLAGRSMDIFITRLRKHLAHDPNVEIVNIHGQGFMLTIKA